MAWNERRKMHFILVSSIFVLCALGMCASMITMSPSEYRRNWLVLMTIPVCCVMLVGISVMLIGNAGRENSDLVTPISLEKQDETSRVWAPCRYDTLDSICPQFCCFRIEKGKRPKWELSRPALELQTTLFAAQAASLSTCLCCLDDFQPASHVALLPCGHVFHEECIASWSVSSASESARSCPACRTKFDEDSVPV
ncbi:unnamed protein product [Symbiodinium natans]|uniref:RING-type domain-containing protein n=1 Tax=Symbiodinium natans TaxID=878477 RepID=A0A812SC42_9DINO|nr:unnamed protein product [Symbiodinium natans]